MKDCKAKIKYKNGNIKAKVFLEENEKKPESIRKLENGEKLCINTNIKWVGSVYL